MENMQSKLLNRQNLASLGIGFSNTHLLYLEKIGAFPKRIRLSPQRVCWSADEIQAYLDGCFAERKGGHNA